MKKAIIGAATASAVVALGALGASAASAADYVYYSSGAGGPKVGRVQVDGTTGRSDSFASFSDTVRGLAATDSAVYVVTKPNSSNDSTLWRVDTSGTKTALFGAGTLMCSSAPSPANAYAMGLATDGTYLYYICEQGTTSSSARYLARASLDGATRNEGFASLSGISASSDTFAVGGGYAYFRGGAFAFGQTDRTYRVALDANATPVPSTNSDQVGAMTWSPAGLFWMNPGGQTKTLSRFPLADFPGWTSTSVFSGLSAPTPPSLAANRTTVFWFTNSNPPTIAKGNADGSGTPETSFVTGLTQIGYLAVVPSGPGGATPTPAPTPAPTPTPTPTASTLATPTVNTDAPGQDAVVTVRTQLGPKGKYTFIFERPTSNEMSREQASSSRVPMQKGTRIGTRKLKKTYTAAVITTTADNAKVVTRALLRKAQAKKLNLRVIHTPTGSAQTESVIKIK